MPSNPALMQCPKGQVCEWRDNCKGATPHPFDPECCSFHHKDCQPCQPVPQNAVEHNGPASTFCPKGAKGLVCTERGVCPWVGQTSFLSGAYGFRVIHTPPCMQEQATEHNGPASIIQALDTASQFGKAANPAFIRAQAEATIEYHKRRDNGENPAWHDVKPVGIPQFL